jgi:hypothetical protein
MIMGAAAGRQSEQTNRAPRSWAWWVWLRGVLSSRERDRENPGGRQGPLASAPAQLNQGRSEGRGTTQPLDPKDFAEPGVVLLFPIRGEALLVKLAHVLRNRIVDRAPGYDPLLLTVSRCPHSRLLIDRSAYADFERDRGCYRAVVESSPGTRVTLETPDFDTLVDFILQYVAARPDAAVACEAS